VIVEEEDANGHDIHCASDWLIAST
jgi:hypothetical protein